MSVADDDCEVVEADTYEARCKSRTAKACFHLLVIFATSGLQWGFLCAATICAVLLFLNAVVADAADQISTTLKERE